MEENRIKKVRQFCVSFMMLCLAFLGVFLVQKKTEPRKVNAEISAFAPDISGDKEELTQTEEMGEPEGGHALSEVQTSAWSHIFGTNIPEIVKQQGDYCVLIRKGTGALDSVSEEMIYRKLTVGVQGSVSEDDVLRISRNALYVGQPKVPVAEIPEELKNVPLVREPKTAEEDSLLSLELSETDGTTKVVLEFNSVYEVELTEDEEFIYLNLIRPHEKYENIVVIDAGHGGRDPGTSGGGVSEASVNLAVVRYVKELLDQQEDWKIYYTRLTNILPDLSTRVEFANALHADMLISVHCNYNPAKSMNGVEVLYSGVQGQGDLLNSKALANICSDYVSEATGLKERKLVERSSNLHIIKYCTMPMALIEFGFMSNASDLALITSEAGQRQCAEAIYRSIESAYARMDEN